MHKYFSLFIVLFISQMIGCTAILWNNSDSGRLATGKVVSTHADRVIVDQDQIVGFAYLKENASSKNSHDRNNVDRSLIVVGQKYAYMIDIGNKEILETIQSDLDPKYWRIKPVRPSDKHFSL